MSKVLVLGATGGIGGEVARQMSAAGWEVCALTRNVDKARREHAAFSWLQGDALNRQAVLAAARGCAVIVHAVNPPGYRNWAEQVVPMIDNSIAAAIAEGATIVLPGTVYNFGPDAFPVLHEDSPQHPQTRKGAIRVQLEQRLQDASRQGARVLIVRAGDFRRAGRQQLVCSRPGQTRQTGARGQLPRHSRGGASMGVPAGCGAHHARVD